MRILPHFPPTPFQTTFSSRNTLLKRLGVVGCALVCIGGLSAARVSAYANRVQAPFPEDGSPGSGPAEIAEGGGQELVTDGVLRISVEAYNKKRERDIAEASQKLLSLAISLKAELERNLNAELSPDAIRKAKAIEKLAHEVKDSMRINLVGP